MNPPPPIFPASGWVTSSAKPTATAASMALPPALRMSRPTSLAIALPDATMPCGASAMRAVPVYRHDGAIAAGCCAAALAGSAASAGDAGEQGEPGVAVNVHGGLGCGGRGEPVT